jgi:anti-sigma factor RsiW
MMEGYRCGDGDTLVAYLYSEIDAEERRRFEAHLATCPACAHEVDALADVRRELASWTPLEPALGCTIVQKSAGILPPVRWWSRPLPVWGQAAAAILVLAAGAAIANVQVRYDPAGFSVSTGWMAESPTAAPASEAPGGAPASSAARAATAPRSERDEAWRTQLAALEAEMRGEMQALRASNVPASPGPVPSIEAAVLKRLQTLIEASEQRQRQELALRLTQFSRDIEMQRRSDLVRIEQGFGQFEGRTGAEVARQRQLLDYLVRTSGRQVVP